MKSSLRSDGKMRNKNNKSQNIYLQISYENDQSRQEDDDENWQNVDNQSSEQEELQNQQQNNNFVKSIKDRNKPIEQKSKLKTNQKNKINTNNQNRNFNISSGRSHQNLVKGLSFEDHVSTKQEKHDFQIEHRIRLNRQLNTVIWAFIVTITILLIGHYYMRKLQQQQAFRQQDKHIQPIQQNKQKTEYTQPNSLNDQIQNSNQGLGKSIQEQLLAQQALLTRNQNIELKQKQKVQSIVKQYQNQRKKAYISPEYQAISPPSSLSQSPSPSPSPSPSSSPSPSPSGLGNPSQIPKYRTPPPPPNQKYSQTLNLKDFQNQTVYLQAPEEIKSIFDKMISRPREKTARPTSVFMPSEKAYFAYRLFKQPENEDYMKAEYYYYETKYRISAYEEQMELCVVAPGRNIVSEGKFKRFIDSIQRQNYSNYRLVYIDDFSDDKSAQKLQQYVKSTKAYLSKLSGFQQSYEGSFIVEGQTYKLQEDPRRLIIVKNTQRLYALANRNKGIREYCPEHSVVLDVDADDAIIGRQAFKFVNAIYHDPEVWMFNSVFIYDKSAQKEVTTGPQMGIPQGLLQNNQYRTGMIWRTSELRTFKAQVFNKINEEDFKNDLGVFYQWASDVFIQMPLVELSGPKHYKHAYQILYFYDWTFNRTTIYKRRHFRDIVFMQTPYQPLEFLEAEPKKVQNYIVPNRIKIEYDKNLLQAKAEAAKYGRQQTF